MSTNKSIIKDVCNIKSIKEYLIVSLKGFAMGVANVIPGVSGGTVAFITGIYEKLISSIKRVASKDFIKKLLTFKIKEILTDQAVLFLIALAIGVIPALAVSSFVFVYTLDVYPELTYSLFAGLVLASIISIFKEIKKWSVSRGIAIVIGTLIAFFVVTRVPVETPQVWWMYLIGGVVFMCAMILPGLSGSFLMLILGQYVAIWGAVKALTKFNITLKNLSVLFFVGIGAVLGLGAFSHLLNWLFKKFHDLTVAVLTGFMVGSLWKLWPWKEIISRSVRSVNNGVTSYETVKEATFQAMAKDPNVVIEKQRILVDNNILPAQFDGQFYGVVALFVIGFITVLVMEIILKKDSSIEIELKE